MAIELLLETTRPRFTVWHTLSLVIIGLLNVGLGAFVYYTRSGPTVTPVFIALSGIAMWTISQGLLLVVTSFAASYALNAAMHVGSIIAVTGAAHFALSYSGRTEWIRYRRVGVLYVISGIWCLAVLTNPIHELLFVSRSYAGELIPVQESIKPLYFVQVGYNWSLTIVALVLMAIEYKNARRGSVYAKQAGLIVFALLIPLFPNILAYGGITQINYSHWAFGATGLLIATSVYRYQWLDLVPVGRDQVIEQVRDGYLVIDEQWRVVDSNPAARGFLATDDPVGEPVGGIFPACLPLLREEETEIQLSLGTATVTVTASPITTETGDGFLLMLRDITEQRRAEKRFQALIENVSDVITVVDPDGTVTYESPSVEDVVGYDPEFLVGENIFDRVHPEDQENAAKEFSELLDNPGNKKRFEFRVRHSDGSWRVFEGVATNPPSNEVVEGIVIASRDVTDRNNRERELEQLTTRLQLALEGTNTGVWEWNLKTDEITGDEQMGQLFALASGEFTGSYDQYLQSIHPADRDDVDATRHAALEDGYYEGEFRIFDNGDTIRWVSSRAEVFFEDGDPVRMLGIVSDITDRKEREQELEETKQHLEQSNEKLDQFAGVVSHDLRNPLNVIAGRTELARETGEEKHLDDIETAVSRMEDMIEDLLTLSRSGQTVDDPEQVNLAAVAREGWENVHANGSELSIDLPATAEVEADRDRLRNVFENLYRNAFEHNDAPVTIVVDLLEPDGCGESHQFAGFIVEDDGVGIPPAKRDEVFSHGFTTNADGTGFGLSIVKDIVNAHGWMIAVHESEVGGAQFEIRTEN